MLAEVCNKVTDHGCLREATSSWSPGGIILLGVIVFIVVAWIKKK